MTPKLCVVIFFLIIGFSYIQNQPHSFGTYISWLKNAKMQGLREMKAACNREHQPNIGDSIIVVKDKDVPLKKLTQVVKSDGEQVKIIRSKREVVAKDVSISPSVETPKPTVDSEGGQKNKRQTSTGGNGNRLRNLINLPIRLNVLANVLSQLSSGVLDSNQGSNAISGRDNSASSLVNAPLDVDAVVNLLSDIDLTNPGSAGSAGKVGGVLQSLLGAGEGKGAGEKGSGLLGRLLGDGEGSGLLGGVLGNTLGDLLQALLSGDGLVGNLLEGLDGKGLVAELLDNLLNGVVDLVDNLLELLVGLLQALLQGQPQTNAANPVTGAQNASPNVLNNEDNNNSALSLINAPIRLNALINILSSLKQELRPQANSAAAGSLLPGSGSSTSTNPSSTGISGNNNALSSLVNVSPDVNLNLNALSEVTDLLSRNAGSQPGSNPNEICFDVPINQADTSVRGNNNRITSAVNIQPTINLDLNLLSRIQQTGSFNGPTQRVCIIRPTRPTAASRPQPTMSTRSGTSSNEICFDVLVDQSDNVVSGNNNQLASLLNLDANIDVGVNLLSNVQQSNALAGFKVRRICLPKQPNTTPAMNFPPMPQSTPAPKEERCFRRTCTRWRQFVDTKCVNTANEYPKYTYTRDI